MHTLIAYSESQDEAGAELNVQAVPDQEVRTDGDTIIVPETFNNIIGVLACIGSTGTRCKLVSPSLRRMNPYEVAPVELALFSSGREYYGMHPQNPIPLAVNESLEALITADPAAAEQQSVVVFTAPGSVSPVQGTMMPIRFSTTATLVAGSWAFSSIDFIDDLPVGNYNVVGASLTCATAVAFRFVPVGGAYRPGAPCYQALNNPQAPIFRRGGLGSWFTFNTTQPPSIEILSSAAAAAATYYGVMDVLTS